MERTPVDEVMERFDLESIWADLEVLEKTAVWENGVAPEWVKALRKELRADSYPIGVFIQAAYRHCAIRAIKRLQELDDIAKGDALDRDRED